MQEAGGRVQSIEKAVKILETLAAAEDPMPLRELARRTQLPKSTLHGIISTLRQTGLVEQSAQDGRYGLGLYLFELGCAASSSRSITSVCRPFLQNLANRAGETAFLAALMAFLVYSTLTGPKKAIARWEENMRRSFGTSELHLCTEFYDRALAQTVTEDDSLVTEGYSAIRQMKETEHLILLRHSASQWFFLAKDGFQGGAAELEKFRAFIAQKIGG